MQNELVALARPEIVAMTPYRSARNELNTGNIWLDANENPWNETPYNRYPEPQPISLLSKLSSLYNISLDELLVTRGSDESIDLIIRLFCRAGKDKIILCPPTYGMYKTAATIQDATILEIPLNKDNFSLNISAILSVWEPAIKLIFLCSPNNPTGNLLSSNDILMLCKSLSTKCIIIVDEAYIEFSQQKSLINYKNRYPNLVILRTLSKAFGLAGIRCGATIADKVIINLLKKIMAPYPIPTSTVEHSILQINSILIKNQIEIILVERDKIFNFLATAFFVKKVWQSAANFILFEVFDKKKVLSHCLSNGIVIRDRSNDYNLNNCLRITIGTPEENNFFIEVMKNV